jgi:GTP-binding protein
VRFIDEVRVRVTAGHGGHGAVAFRREKYVPFGGPSGGDGGRGGSVILEGDEGMSTLLDLTYSRLVKADSGKNGANKDMNGRGGCDKVVRVAVGTQVFDETLGELVGDITEHQQQLVVARGGRGGLGNIHFATSTDRAPRKATQGTPGEERELRLELKVLADVGLLGFPNAGKSTFVSAVSAARPKIADYPFTTLVPKLGSVRLGGGPAGGGASFVVADIPGLIRGASEGVGLGHRFLKHVERSRALLHLVTLDPDPEREPFADYLVLREELTRFDPNLAKRPEVVVLSQSDRTDVREAYDELAKRFREELGVELGLISAVTGDGIPQLLEQLAQLLRPEAAAPESLAPESLAPESLDDSATDPR